MAEFVRICPKCGMVNPEYENLCTACDQFIGMEGAVPVPRETAPPEPEPEPGGPQPARDQATRRYVPEAESFFLQLQDGDLLLTATAGSELGQSHASSDAGLQIPDTVAGSRYLHRRHCRFEWVKGQWLVTAIDQSASGSEFTNPTFVNQHRLAPGDSHPLSDGDQLRLSGVTFSVRMV